ncbi:hypothetical protein L596_016358 [Steinernema carpocapsae]|uniref:Uncharacterized protein n=1 Tax=Steinernema carpocapsae TaxID=34508 RepID=A0A4U5NIR1_STECR|nr:hypothetical protein L596_016358 [Steinernema carpocapsae]
MLLSSLSPLFLHSQSAWLLYMLISLQKTSNWHVLQTFVDSQSLVYRAVPSSAHFETLAHPEPAGSPKHR